MHFCPVQSTKNGIALTLFSNAVLQRETDDEILENQG